MLLDSLDPKARMMFLDWLKDLARTEEHSACLEIVRFTNRRARGLVRDAGPRTASCPIACAACTAIHRSEAGPPARVA